MAKVWAVLCGLLWSGWVLAEKPLAPEDIEGVTRVTAEQLIDLITMTPNLVIVDARRSEEHQKGHIEGAVSILDSDMTEYLLSAVVPSKQSPVVFYCNGPRCLRSSNACKKALGWGYQRVYWFRGGWREWLDKELPYVYN